MNQEGYKFSFRRLFHMRWMGLILWGMLVGGMLNHSGVWAKTINSVSYINANGEIIADIAGTATASGTNVSDNVTPATITTTKDASKGNYLMVASDGISSSITSFSVSEQSQMRPKSYPRTPRTSRARRAAYHNALYYHGYNYRLRRLNYTPFFMALSAGASGFGSIWFGKPEGNPFFLNLEGAYYFKKMLGAGININTSISNIHIKDIGLIGRETLWFVSPAINGRLFYKKFVFKAGTGIGFLKGTFSRDYYNNDYDYGIYKLAVSGFVSVSASYMITERLGAGLKMQTNIGKMNNEAYTRNPTAIGYTLGINYNF